jgi:hypothetical protein
MTDLTFFSESGVSLKSKYGSPQLSRPGPFLSILVLTLHSMSLALKLVCLS